MIYSFTIQQVPLQENNSDCGIFWLHYIEKILEDAPEKLIFQNLDEIFNYNWFLPIEASNLRKHIQKIILEQIGAKSESTINLFDGKFL